MPEQKQQMRVMDSTSLSANLATMKKETVDSVALDVNMNRDKLNLPVNYSVSNALQSAWLILQETFHNEKPVLSSCTKISIYNTLYDMVIQGLNPVKDQCYFIPYGNRLTCTKSYFGTMVVAKTVDPTIADIVAEVVYEDDTLKYRIERGNKIITEHEQQLENVDKKKIKAAYAMVINQDGSIRTTEIMTMEQIKQSWKQSKIKPIDEKGNVKEESTHGKFTAEMCKRTVINKLCKPIINSSNDAILLKSVHRSEEIEVEQDIAENANQEFIDVKVIDEPEILETNKMETQKDKPEKNQVIEKIKAYADQKEYNLEKFKDIIKNILYEGYKVNSVKEIDDKAWPAINKRIKKLLLKAEEMYTAEANSVTDTVKETDDGCPF